MTNEVSPSEKQLIRSQDETLILKLFLDLGVQTSSPAALRPVNKSTTIIVFTTLHQYSLAKIPQSINHYAIRTFVKDNRSS